MKFIWNLIRLAVLAGLAVFGYAYFTGQDLSQIKSFDAVFPDKFEATLSLPGPLRAEFDAENPFLTLEGVVRETNARRAADGLGELFINTALNRAAELKIADMFARQYFAHETPDGRPPSDFAKDTGYVFIEIGENLALGNYENDEKIVQAWMDSPGHQANILKRSYEEIGVAVGQGEFEGKQTWLAVQLFGRPQSSCPAPNDDLELRVQNTETEINAIKAELEVRSDRIETAETARDDRYEQMVEEFNNLVAEHNRLVELNKNLAQEYNEQVASFNACLKP